METANKFARMNGPLEKIASGFFGDTAIKEITFPASVKTIHSGALGANNMLKNRNKLQKVTFLHRKKLPSFSGSTPIAEYIKTSHKKVTFCVKNPKMKSSLNKKLKKEKLKSKKYNVPGIKKWNIKVS